MKLKEFKPTIVRIGKPTINFNRNGAISISQTAVEKAGITAEKKISFFQDESRPKDWYFSVSEGVSEFKIRKHTKNGSMLFNCKSLQQEIIASLGLDTDTNISFPIGEVSVVDGVKLYPIITSKI